MLEADGSGWILDGAARLLERRRASECLPWYKPFIQGVVVPHISLFATLIIAGELVAGVTLLLGIATRAGAIIAIALNCNYLMAKGLPPWAPASNDAADIILAVTVLLCSAGRYYGLDAILAKRGPGRRVV